MTDTSPAKDATIDCVAEEQEEEHPINLHFKWQTLSISPKLQDVDIAGEPFSVLCKQRYRILSKTPGVLLPSVKLISSVATIQLQGIMHAVTVLDATRQVL